MPAFARSSALGLLSLLLFGCGVLAERSDPNYFYEYDASCPALSDSARRAEVLRIGTSLAEQFSGKFQIDSSDRNIYGGHVDLPLIPGAPPYRRNASGQIVLSTQSDRLGSTVGIVIYKVPKEEDELARSIKKRVESELAVNCPKWKTEAKRSIY